MLCLSLSLQVKTSKSLFVDMHSCPKVSEKYPVVCFEQIPFEESLHPQVLCPFYGMKNHSGMILNYSAFRKKMQKIVTVNSSTSGKYLQASVGI